MSFRTRALWAGLGAWLAAVPPAAGHSPDQRASLASSGWPLGDFNLQDHYGKPFAASRLGDRWTLLAVADSRCREPCSGTLSALAGLLRRISGAKVLRTTQVVVLSLRAEDTPADMRRLISAYDPRFVGVTGALEELKPVADDLGIAFDSRTIPTCAGYNTQDSHEGSIWLIGPDRVIRTEWLPPFDILLLTAAYLKTRLAG